jgi:hypothetical protein
VHTKTAMHACGRAQAGIFESGSCVEVRTVKLLMQVNSVKKPSTSSPEQLRHTNTPRLTLAHVGPRDPQSAHRRFSSCLSSADRIALCRSFC